MRYLLFLFIALCPLSAAFGQGSYALSGIVTGPDGRPLAGVLVTMQCGHHSQWSHEIKTGADGKYRFEKLECDSYLTTFYANDFESQRQVLSNLPKVTGGYVLDVQMQKNGTWGPSVRTHIYKPIFAAPPARRSDKSGGYAKAKKPDVFSGPRHMMLPEPTAAAAAPPSAKGEVMKAKSAAGRTIAASRVVRAEKPGAVATKISAGATTVESRELAAMPSREAEERDAADDRTAADGRMMLARPEAKSGTLTSGELNDFSKWTLWEDLSMENLKAYRTAWPFRPEQRYEVIVKSRQGTPLANAHVKLTNGRDAFWEAMTDNTGKAELWYGMYEPGQKPVPERFSAEVEHGREHYSIPLLKAFGAGANILDTKISCLNSAKLDIAFIVDATGSMQDEIDYLKAELRDILQKVHDSMPATDVQTGALFYRDVADEYLTRASDLTADFAKTEAFIADNNADGGGDFPEALDAALEAGLGDLHWRVDATARLAFLVLDAPPHDDTGTVKKMQRLAAQYAAHGIRLIPVVCSGSDKPTEYLMRSLALATNGTYLFLTDHSGIGGGHTSPTTSEKVDVEYLNGLICRVIYQFAYMPACSAENLPADTAHVQQHTDSATTISWRYWPNPTSGILHIGHTHTSGWLLITDITGKAILRVPADASGTTTIDLGQYPAGIYAIRYNWRGDEWLTGKFVVVH